MENIFNSITGQDLLSRMYNIFKIKLTDMSQASAMTSFETELPKFFLKTPTVKINEVIDHSKTCFASVETWEAWDLPYEGMRSKLNKFLQRFRESHQSRIDDQIPIGSVLHTIAKLSLTDSCEWVGVLTEFVDQTYRHFETAKFDKAKAWHIYQAFCNPYGQVIYSQR